MNPVAPATVFDWKKQAKSFDSMTSYAWNEVNLTGDREPQKIQSFHVAANFFETIGVQPQLGRAFLPEEEEAGKDQEIILGHALWEQRYASDPNILGKNIKVTVKSFTVVGVMKKGFDYPMPAEAWLPCPSIPKSAAAATIAGSFRRPSEHGVSFEQATAEMQAISAAASRRLSRHQPRLDAAPTLSRNYMTGDLTKQYMILLLGAVGFVLLIACANVANVQFARVTGRTGEFAIRSAMGGRSWQIVRQLLVESILLSLGGAALGLFFAQWNIDMILSHMPADVAKFVAGWKTIRLDANAFLFAIGISVASGILSGIAPSLISSQTNVAER